MEQKWQSEHIFLFPFSWKIDTNPPNYLFEPQQAIQDECFKSIKGWRLEPNEMSMDIDYNKYVYFYKPVRNVLYNNDFQIPISLNYKHQISNGIVHLKVANEEYVLTLFQMKLKIYKTGIGILSFHLKNKDYKAFDDIRAINSLSKCVYPPMLPLDKMRQDIYPQYVKVDFKDNEYCSEYFEEDYLKNPGKISNFIMCLLGESFIRGEHPKIKDRVSIEAIMGSRMITFCLYENKQWLQKIQQEELEEYDLESLICVSERSKYAVDISYVKSPYRLYSISAYGLMCISEKEVDSNVYDELTHLVVLQKATLLNFSTQLAYISTLDKEHLVPSIESAYEIYIQFINQMYFEEVTEDLQGTKIYKLFTEQFNIKGELMQLGFEMREVHKYAQLVSQARSRLKMDILTVVGAALVLPTFVTGFFGMNIMEGMFSSWWQHKEIFLWLNTYALLPILIVIIFSIWNNKRNKFHVFFKLGTLLAILISLSILIFFGCGLNQG